MNSAWEGAPDPFEVLRNTNASGGIINAGATDTDLARSAAAMEFAGARRQDLVQKLLRLQEEMTTKEALIEEMKKKNNDQGVKLETWMSPDEVRVKLETWMSPDEVRWR